MKYKTTAKALKNGYAKIISVGYCGLQSLLQYKNPVAYSSGIYGWNFDVYDINGIAIATGYRGMPSKNSNANYDLAREYENKSQGMTKDIKENLILEFVEMATKKNKNG